MSLNKLFMPIVLGRVYLHLKVSVAQMASYLNTFLSQHLWTLVQLTSLRKTLQAHQVAAFQCNLYLELPLVDLLVEW